MKRTTAKGVVYLLTNKYNNKRYVGSTINTWAVRYNLYRKELQQVKKGYIRPRPVIKAILDYGWDNIQLDILEEGIINEDDLRDLETYYIGQYKTYEDLGGYNAIKGTTLSKDMRKRLSESKQGRLLTPEQKQKLGKAIIELTTGHIFNNSKEADNYFKIDKSRDVATGYKGSNNGYVFRWLSSSGQVDTGYKTIPVSKKVFNNIKEEYKIYAVCGVNKTTRAVLELTTGKKYQSVREAARELNLSAGNITNNAAGTLGTVKGYVFRYVALDGTIHHEDTFKKPKSKAIIQKVLSQYKEVV